MDIRNGNLIQQHELANLLAEEQKHFIEVKRDITKLEEATMQIRKYSPCGCGSGKKFKFCCWKPELGEPNE